MKSPIYKTNTADEFFYDESFEDYVDNADFGKALKVMTYFLKKDADLYYAYQANIAMAFVDEFNYAMKRSDQDVDVKDVANDAARTFLDRLIDS